MARVAVVIVNYRTPSLALDAARALAGERAALSDLTVTLVDGGSADGSAETIADGLRNPALAGWTELLALPVNGGFGWANNQAIQRLLQSAHPPDYIHLLNPDTRIVEGAVAALVAVLDTHLRCGAVGSLLLEPDGSPSGSAFSFLTPASLFSRATRFAALERLCSVPPLALLGIPAREVDWATGASVLLRAAALRECGLFDTGFFLYFEEVELMWRMTRAGWTIRHEPASRVVHVGGAATGVNATAPTDERPALPRYWYESRRRYLTLTHGRPRAFAGLLSWLGGHALFRLASALQLRRGHTPVAEEGRRHLRYGLWPNPADTRPAIARWDDPPALPPAWIKHHGPRIETYRAPVKAEG